MIIKTALAMLCHKCVNKKLHEMFRAVQMVDWFVDVPAFFAKNWFDFLVDQINTRCHQLDAIQPCIVCLDESCGDGICQLVTTNTSIRKL